ncbi:hypothetical protein AeMF1_011340 [Aphanomyces euteiches]|nr:hypothetical protein AeMF1_011340 [Aphanomyces euteiches]KAH9190176.1 hypothetical protein AeNC1_007842 [Aphanomyces euteiches]
MSFIDVVQAPLHRPSFERHKSIKDMRHAMTRQPSIIDQMLTSTLSKSSLQGSRHKLNDSMRHSVRKLMVHHINKAIAPSGSTRSIGSTISSALKSVNGSSQCQSRASIQEEEPISSVPSVPKLSAAQEEHIEDIRQAVIRLVADGNVHVELDGKDHVGYNHQGNLVFYTDENLHQRLALRVNPLLCRLTHFFWLMIFPTDARKGEMSFDHYQALMLRIHKVLLELFDVDESKILIREDWVRDTNATHHLTYELFHLSLFEIIDIWCDSLRPEDYCNLLFLLMHGIARIHDGSIELKRLEDVVYTDVIQQLEENPLSGIQIEAKLDEFIERREAKAAAAARALQEALQPTPIASIPENSTDDSSKVNLPQSMNFPFQDMAIQPPKPKQLDVYKVSQSLQAAPQPAITKVPPPARTVPPQPQITEKPAAKPTGFNLSQSNRVENAAAQPPPRNVNQAALHPKDMENILANASPIRNTNIISSSHRVSSLSPHARRSQFTNPHIKDSRAPSTTYATDTFNIRSLSAIPAIEEVRTPPEPQETKQPTDSRPVFSLAGAKSPMGHPIWKPQRPGNDANRFGAGQEPPKVSGGDAFAVKRLGGASQYSTGAADGRPLNYVGSMTPTSMEPLVSSGFGVLGGKTLHRTPKETSRGLVTGIVLAKADGRTGGIQADTIALPFNKASEMRPSMSSNDASWNGVSSKKRRYIAKRAGVYASEMVQSLANLSFGMGKQPSSSSTTLGTSKAASTTPQPTPPVVPSSGNIDGANGTSRFAQMYRSGQRLTPYASRSEGRHPLSDDKLAIQSSGATSGSATTSTPQRVDPLAINIAKPNEAVDRNLSNLQLNAQSIGRKPIERGNHQRQAPSPIRQPVLGMTHPAPFQGGTLQGIDCIVAKSLTKKP